MYGKVVSSEVFFCAAVENIDVRRKQKTAFVQTAMQPCHLLALLLCVAGSLSDPPRDLSPRQYEPLPLGSIAPQGWLLDQLVRQAGSLSGYLSSTQNVGASISHLLSCD